MPDSLQTAGDQPSPAPPPALGQPNPPPPGPPMELTRAGCLTFLLSRVGRQILLIAGLLLLIFVLNKYVSYRADEKASDWLTSYNGVVTTNVVGPINADLDPKSVPSLSPTATPESASTLSSASENQASGSASSPGVPPSVAPVGSTVSSTPSPIPPPTAEEEQRLKNQLRTIRDRIRHHGAVMAFFYEAYYVAIVMVMFAGVLGAVTLFFIAQKGWEHTSDYIETIFIFMTATVAFYALFPPVFQQEKNITDNKQLFLTYKVLESEVESYPVTHRTIKNEPKLPSEFINHIDAEMERIGNIALGFDITKINYTDAIELNPKPKTAGSPIGAATPGETRGRR